MILVDSSYGGRFSFVSEGGEADSPAPSSSPEQFLAPKTNSAAVSAETSITQLPPDVDLTPKLIEDKIDLIDSYKLFLRDTKNHLQYNLEYLNWKNKVKSLERQEEIEILKENTNLRKEIVRLETEIARIDKETNDAKKIMLSGR